MRKWEKNWFVYILCCADDSPYTHWWAQSWWH